MTAQLSAERLLIVGTRGSRLALTQTEMVLAALRSARPDIRIRIERITTRGDVLQDVPLTLLGGQGVFVDAIEQALRDERIDLAVHSAKDLPSTIGNGLTIAAWLQRADPRDVLVSRAGSLEELPGGARIGTSSLRRSCQLLAARPDLTIADLRGNVDTRLRKLDAGGYDAIVLAAAGLLRLGLAAHVTQWLDPRVMLPAPGQGALAVEARSTDGGVRDVVAPLRHAPTESALQAERALLQRLGVGCAAAVGAFADFDDEGTLRLTAMIGSSDGRRIVRESVTGSNGQSASQLGTDLAEHLLAAGGRELLASAGPRVPL